MNVGGKIYYVTLVTFEKDVIALKIFEIFLLFLWSAADAKQTLVGVHSLMDPPLPVEITSIQRPFIRVDPGT